MAACFNEKGHKAHLYAMFLFESIFIKLAQLDHCGHVDLIIGGQHGGGILGFFEAARDGLAQTSHFHAFFTLLIFKRCRGARDYHCSGRSCGCCSDAKGLRRGASHIFFHNTTIAASSCHVTAT